MSSTASVEPRVEGLATEASAKEPFHALDAQAVMHQLATSGRGLTEEEAERRLRLYGPNVVERGKRDSAWVILFRQINNPLVWVLLASALLAVVIGKVVDGLVVFAVVLLNAVIGFVQEFRARHAIESLAAMVPEHAMVIRAGHTIRVAVSSLVQGDIVTLASGDRVPADARLLHAKSLRIDESPLTGESVATEKNTRAVDADAELGDRACMAYGGTLVTYGTGTIVVVATGAKTEMGHISRLLASTAELETPLTRALGVIGKYITVGIGGVSTVILGVGVIRAMNAGLTLAEALREVLLFAIALAVGAIPEGLPAIVTIALAIGVRRMATRSAIIRKLPAVETLGSTTIICSDKTGTLTRNEMTVREVITPNEGALRVEGTGYAPFGHFARPDGTKLDAPPEELRLALEQASLCNDSTLVKDGDHYTITGDPTEGALVVAAEKAGLAVVALRESNTRVDAIPFESEYAFMATLHAAQDGTQRIVMKGAPEAVLGRVEGAHGAALEGMRAQVEGLARQGMRVLAVAVKDLPTPLQELDFPHVADGFRLSALIGMIDPPRAEVIRAIDTCKQAGIVVKMITGDHLVTAQAIAKELGLANPEAALTGRELSSMDARQISDSAATVSVFARVAPEHKLKLVEALQARGNVVAMTGDGVNDAPALRQANIGVAMGITGTSVSKEAADMVLVDDNFATIVAAVEEGRRVYDNLIKSLAFVLPTNIALALIMIVAVVAFPFDANTQVLLLPIAPTQLLWINLVATVTLALPLAFESKEPDVMIRPPRDPGAPVMTREVVIRTIVAAVLMTAGVLWVFLRELSSYTDMGRPPAEVLSIAQTMAVTTAIAFQVFYVLNCRSLRAGLLQIGLFSNPLVFAGMGAIVALQALFVYFPPFNALFVSSPLSAREALVSLGVGALALPLMGLEKALARRREGRR